MVNTLKNSSAFEACEKLYLNEEFADVNFVFGVDDKIEKVPANKAILAVLSSVFRTMFYGSLPEKGDVQITDADADGFKEFLQFFYLGNVKLTIENIGTVVRLADKYDILGNINARTTFLEGELTLDNICQGYQLAVNLQNRELIDFCEKKIIRSPREVFATDEFQRCDKSILTRILDLDFACNEAEVFDACLIWAKNACEKESLDDTQAGNLRHQLGDCLKQIRFGAMKVAEFNQRYMIHKGLFTAEEFEEIMLSITMKEYKPKIFDKKARLEYKHTWNEAEVLKCQRKSSVKFWREPKNRKGFIEDSEVIFFSSNHLLLLGEIRTVMIEGSIKSTEIEIIITEGNNLTFDSSPMIIYRGTNGKFGGKNNGQLIVTLPHPIVIQPQKIYEIRLNIKKNDRYKTLLYYSYFKQMVEMADGIKIQFHRNPTLNYVSLSNGWISEMFFKKISNILN